MTSQISSRIQVSWSRYAMRYAEERAPAGATNQTSGVLKGRGRLGSRILSTSTPQQTITNARRVPMDTSLAASRTGRMAAGIETASPVTIDVMYGVRNRG